MDTKYLEHESAPIGPETWKLLSTVMVEAARGQLPGGGLSVSMARSGSGSRQSRLVTANWKKAYPGACLSR